MICLHGGILIQVQVHEIAGKFISLGHSHEFVSLVKGAGWNIHFASLRKLHVAAFLWAMTKVH